MRFETLEKWLKWLETLHSQPMEMGLTRIGEVANRLGILTTSIPVITVGGTNGKGSTVGYLESVYRKAGYSVGATVSPHLLRFNERIRLDGEELSDESIMAFFQEIDQARGDITMTYFEFGMLAAMLSFIRNDVDVILLEVGLGGRLDACNLWDTDLAIITNVALDHQTWLGNSRETIAAEKVRIARAGKPLVCGDKQPPCSLVDGVADIKPEAFFRNDNYHHIIRDDGHFSVYLNGNTESLFKTDFAAPGMTGEWQYDNAANVIVAISLLQEKLPVSAVHIDQGISSTQVSGRFQEITVKDRRVILDVGHNPLAASSLAGQLAKQSQRKVFAVVGIMQDKDVKNVIGSVIPHVHSWYVGDLALPRAMPAKALSDLIEDETSSSITIADNLFAAFEQAISESNADDIVLVFGSFHTVGEVLQELNK